MNKIEILKSKYNKLSLHQKNVIDCYGNVNSMNDNLLDMTITAIDFYNECNHQISIILQEDRNDKISLILND